MIKSRKNRQELLRSKKHFDLQVDSGQARRKQSPVDPIFSHIPRRLRRNLRVGARKDLLNSREGLVDKD